MHTYPMTNINFRVKTQAAAYSEGTKDAYDLLVTMLEEGGINQLLEGIELNARPETVQRMNDYYRLQNLRNLEG